MNELELWESMFGNSTNATAGSLVVNYKDFINRVEEYGNQRELEGRIDENAWSRGQMIAWQAYEAPNSGFGRMVKSAIRLFNERKLKLIEKQHMVIPHPPSKAVVGDWYYTLSEEAKQAVAKLIIEARLEEYKKHFIPHGKNQIETVYYLPGKRFSLWGTTDLREAYDRHIAELEDQLKEK